VSILCSGWVSISWWFWYKHPHFTPEESSVFFKNAFRRDFDENGPSVKGAADTVLRGAANTTTFSGNVPSRPGCSPLPREHCW
jgi:hypothetical protein